MHSLHGKGKQKRKRVRMLSSCGAAAPQWWDQANFPHACGPAAPGPCRRAGPGGGHCRIEHRTIFLPFSALPSFPGGRLSRCAGSNLAGHACACMHACGCNEGNGTAEIRPAVASPGFTFIPIHPLEWQTPRPPCLSRRAEVTSLFFRWMEARFRRDRGITTHVTLAGGGSRQAPGSGG